MTALEQEAERQGTSTDFLMETAGLAVAEYARQRLGGVAGKSVVILVGPGNNGADGLVSARHLRRWGAGVTACLLTRRPEVDHKMDLARDYGVATLNLAAGAGMDTFERLLARSHLVIDSVLGTGRSRALQGVVREALLQVAAIREGSGHPLLLALDVPTGLDSDTGAVDDATPAMDATLALGFPKAGLLSFPGAGRVGELVTLDIGLPNGVGQDDIALELLTPGVGCITASAAAPGFPQGHLRAPAGGGRVPQLRRGCLPGGPGGPPGRGGPGNPGHAQRVSIPS